MRRSIETLQDIINDTRLKVWAKQPAAFFDQAIIDMDSFLVETTGLMGASRYEREGDDLAGRGLYLDLPEWGYHVFEMREVNN